MEGGGGSTPIIDKHFHIDYCVVILDYRRFEIWQQYSLMGNIDYIQNYFQYRFKYV